MYFPFSLLTVYTQRTLLITLIANILQEYTRLHQNSQNLAYSIAIYADGTYASPL